MQATANIWEALCRDLESERQTATAEQYQEIARKFLHTAHQVLRADSPRLCDAIEIAGDVCQAAGQLPEAATNFQTALDKARHLQAAGSCARLTAKLALLNDRLGHAREARAFYEEALALYAKQQDHSQHVMLLNQLGALCKREGDFAAAEKYYQESMDLASRLHGGTHPETATAANNLGVTYSDMGDYVRAENLHMQALSIRENSFGAMHPDVAQSMANLAVVYHLSGNLNKARAFYAGALKIYLRFRTADDQEVKNVQANYDTLLHQLEAGQG